MPQGGGILHVYSDIQDASNQGSTINLGFAPTFLYVFALKNNTYSDTYYYEKDENGNETEHYVRVASGSGRIDDTLTTPFLFWSADRTSFAFHGAGGTSGVTYYIYAYEGNLTIED